MTTYYVRKSGSDGNNGLTPATAFLTIGKLIGAAGVMVTGDVGYVGAGIYREQITVTPTFTATTQVFGDVDGAQTGDAGEVRLTAYLVGDVGTGTGTPLNWSSKNFLQISGIVYQALGNVACITNFSGHDCSITDSAFFWTGGGGAITGTLPVDTNSANVIDRCYFFGFGASAISLTLPTSTVADYNANVLIRNCMSLIVSGSGNNFVDIASSGANAFFGGGIVVQNCSSFAGSVMRTIGTTLSTTFPCKVFDSLCYVSATAIVAGAAGQILEDGNVLVCNTARTNVTAGVHSVAGTTTSAMISMGHERIWGEEPLPFGYLHASGSPIGSWGSYGTPAAVDIMNRPRPAGQSRRLTAGIFSSATALTATDSTATWGTNAFSGAVVKITGGTGAGQVKWIKSHTPTILTVFGNWVTTPDATSTYEIYYGAIADNFKPTAHTNTTNATSTLASGSWTVNSWSGYTAKVTAGTGVGQTLPVASNTATVLTFVGVWGTPLNTADSVITLYRATSENTVNNAAGALERHNRTRRETTLVDSGGVCWALDGWSDQKLEAAVDAGIAVTLSVRVSWTTDHGDTNKPRIELIANGEIGVSGQTATAAGSAGSGTFETLSITFTPTAKGVATFRLRSRADKPNGYASFDTVTVT